MMIDKLTDLSFPSLSNLLNELQWVDHPPSPTGNLDSNRSRFQVYEERINTTEETSLHTVTVDENLVDDSRSLRCV